VAVDGSRCLEELVAARISGLPLEHVLGWVEFCSERLFVGAGVFVPRRRSEALAAVAIDRLREIGAADGSATPSPVFLEAFCGIAPIASTVARALPAVEVIAADLDPVALDHARKNLRAATADVYCTDVLVGLPARPGGGIDVIAAVAPYVPNEALGLMPREARDFEPASALDGGEDGLDLVRRLVEQAPAFLAPRGELLLEVNEDQVPSITRHARGHGFVGAQVRAREDRTVVLGLASEGRSGRESEEEPPNARWRRGGSSG
jgi:release factor glutamine methyltransferase